MNIHYSTSQMRFDDELKRLRESIKNYERGLLKPGELILHILGYATEMQREMCRDHARMELHCNETRECECEHPDGIPIDWNLCPSCGLKLNRSKRKMPIWNRCSKCKHEDHCTQHEYMCGKNIDHYQPK